MRGFSNSIGVVTPESVIREMFYISRVVDERREALEATCLVNKKWSVEQAIGSLAARSATQHDDEALVYIISPIIKAFASPAAYNAYLNTLQKLLSKPYGEPHDLSRRMRLPDLLIKAKQIAAESPLSVAWLSPEFAAVVLAVTNQLPGGNYHV